VIRINKGHAERVPPRLRSEHGRDMGVILSFMHFIGDKNLHLLFLPAAERDERGYILARITGAGYVCAEIVENRYDFIIPEEDDRTNNDIDYTTQRIDYTAQREAAVRLPPATGDDAAEMHFTIDDFNPNVWAAQNLIRTATPRRAIADIPLLEPAAAPDLAVANIVQYLRRDYSASYVRVRKQNRFLYVRDVSVVKETTSFRGYLFEKNGTLVEEAATIPVEDINLNLPKLGMINASESSLYLSRYPNRQWFKGFRDRNIKKNACVYLPGGIPIEDIDWRTMARATFYKELTPPMEALKQVLDCDMYSRAISKNLCVAQYPEVSNPVLRYKKWVVGTFDDNGRVELGKDSKHLVEEVSQFYEVANVENL
jgi:hypothetical protein